MTRRRKDGDGAPVATKARAPRKPRAPRKGKPADATEAATQAAAPVVEHGDATLATTSPAALVRVPLDVRWRDLDAFSHVNNATFLTFIEEARLHWFQSLPGPWLSEDVAPVLAASHVNYRRPIEWPARLAVELYAERVGATSLTLAHRIVAADDASRLYSDGYAVLVWIDRHDGRPAALPDAVRAACKDTHD